MGPQLISLWGKGQLKWGPNPNKTSTPNDSNVQGGAHHAKEEKERRSLSCNLLDGSNASVTFGDAQKATPELGNLEVSLPNESKCLVQ